jgi:hypothetical protein
MIRVRAGISFALAEAQSEGHCGRPFEKAVNGLGFEARGVGHALGGARRIGGFEANATDVFRQPVGVFRHRLHGVGAVGFVDAHRSRSPDARGSAKTA